MSRVVGTQTTHSFVEVFRQIREVEIGRSVVTLGLESGIEALTSETNFVTELIEAANALL